MCFKSVDESLVFDHSNESYSIEQYFLVVLFIMLYKVATLVCDHPSVTSVYWAVLHVTFKSVDEILVCDHSNESYSIEQYFRVVLFITLWKAV